jgi:hypothetical protein
MRAGIVVNVTRADRHRLEAIVLDRNAPQKHVWRANIIHTTGFDFRRIISAVPQPSAVARMMAGAVRGEGVEGLTRDKNPGSTWSKAS